MALFRRDKVPAAIRALQDQLAGGPRVELPPELELLGGLVHTREERAKTKDEPERELLAALPDAAAVVGKDGAVRVANAAFETLAPGGRAAGLSPLEITRSAELAEAVRRGLEGHVRRLHFEAPATRRVWLAHLSPLLRGEVLLLLRDVTEAKRGEAMRRDFVANASHELRTPVAAIRGAAETLLAGALAEPDSARHFVDMVARHAERLARLTQDLLDLSRIESGQWTMELCRVELSGLAQGVLDLHADRAAEKALRLARDVPEGLAARADPRALEQVLVNLIDNAV
jgi:two-component system phosphate regulon sensor histidine kinase PhoR